MAALPVEGDQALNVEFILVIFKNANLRTAAEELISSFKA